MAAMAAIKLAFALIILSLEVTIAGPNILSIHIIIYRNKIKIELNSKNNDYKHRRRRTRPNICEYSVNVAHLAVSFDFFHF